MDRVIVLRVILQKLQRASSSMFGLLCNGPPGKNQRAYDNDSMWLQVQCGLQLFSQHRGEILHLSPMEVSRQAFPFCQIYQRNRPKTCLIYIHGHLLKSRKFILFRNPHRIADDATFKCIFFLLHNQNLAKDSKSTIQQAKILLKPFHTTLETIHLENR